jgi:DNA polymerase elongation subunit (family B)
MGDVVYYCAIDCVRPHELFVKRLIMLDKRELSNLAFVSLYASFYRADGMKVRNLMGHYALKFGLAFSNAHREVDPAKKDHYPGAWVCVPERCLNRVDPVAGMDYSSLYPSLIMTYNLSIDMVVYTRERADELAALGYVLHQVGPFQYERGPEKGKAGNEIRTGLGWMVRHNGILEPSDTKTVTHYRRKAVYPNMDAPVYDSESAPPAPGDHYPVTKPSGVTNPRGAEYSFEPAAKSCQTSVWACSHTSSGAFSTCESR